MSNQWKNQFTPFDDRRYLYVAGDPDQTIDFCVQQFVSIAQEAIETRGYFAVALSGGGTPQKIYQLLAQNHEADFDWSRVYLFWGDERSVPKDHPESNFYNAMKFLGKLPIKSENIFGMPAEFDLEKNAREYEQLILSKIPDQKFDLIMLGMGEDGHTASLFPKTHGLKEQQRLVTENHVPQLQTWRMSLTYPCIEKARYVSVIVLNASKAAMVNEVLNGPYQPDVHPIQKIGTAAHPAYWILDEGAASKLC